MKENECVCERPSVMIIEAIVGLEDKKGSSPSDIVTFVANKYGIQESIAKRHVRAAIKRGLKFGVLSESDGFYRLRDDGQNTVHAESSTRPTMCGRPKPKCPRPPRKKKRCPKKRKAKKKKCAKKRKPRKKKKSCKPKKPKCPRPRRKKKKGPCDDSDYEGEYDDEAYSYADVKKLTGFRPSAIRRGAYPEVRRPVPMMTRRSRLMAPPDERLMMDASYIC